MKYIIIIFVILFSLHFLTMEDKSMYKLKKNLISVIFMGKAKGIDVLLTSVPDISLFTLYKEITGGNDIYLIRGLRAKTFSDPSLKSGQIYPNTKVYKKIVEKTYETLKEYG